MEHVCSSEEEIKDISNEVKDLATNMALVKKDTQDLKLLSGKMGDCIEALTRASIISAESHITREQFYKKFEELAVTRTTVVNACMKEFNEYKNGADAKIDALEKQAEQNKNVCDDYKDQKKIVIGLAVAFIGFLLVQAYLLLTHSI